MPLSAITPMSTGLASRLAEVSKQAAASRVQTTVTRLSSIHPAVLAAENEAASLSLTRRPEVAQADKEQEQAQTSEAAATQRAALARRDQAELKIRDADMAEETVAFAKAQIRQQQGAAMLVQGGISSQSLLSLVRG